ncbi:MAG: Peptide methionine sulfoxide reductase MsrA [Parcubacteria group bacterium GW2011_GWB1_40_14]|nr:MAG: Peptide methionine sulfoxide reductase MsrA [Parcubacteria group bacterium GW2011_GWB1_40_14]
MDTPKNIKIAIFGGGCFWCTEAVFSAGGGSAYGGKTLNGIISVTSGYAGGTPSADGRNPTYEEVSGGKTGHAEVIRVEYDPTIISYKDLLAVFFATHDPTTLNRQGNDAGTQYRSTILYTDEAQKQEAENFIKELEVRSSQGASIVTEVKQLEKFYEAEQYHKDYYENNPQNPYCQVVIASKVAKAQHRFAELLKEQDTK